MSVEATLAKQFGYEYCVLFERARAAISAYCEEETPEYFCIPTNVCPLIGELFDGCEMRPIDESGLVKGIHLYGYRHPLSGTLDLDPLMTGWFRQSNADAMVISFGRKKALELGVGGAILLDDADRVKEMEPWAYFPDGLRSVLAWRLKNFWYDMQDRWQRVEWWDRHLSDSCIRIPGEQVIPWRVIRRIPDKRDAVVKALRDAGFDAGTNYPPLPGVTDPGAIQWGREVINLWVTPDYDEARIRAGAEIIKRAIG